MPRSATVSFSLLLPATVLRTQHDRPPQRPSAFVLCRLKALQFSASQPPGLQAASASSAKHAFAQTPVFASLLSATALQACTVDRAVLSDAQRSRYGSVHCGNDATQTLACSYVP
jgi:hypothetical protein